MGWVVGIGLACGAVADRIGFNRPGLRIETERIFIAGFVSVRSLGIVRFDSGFHEVVKSRDHDPFGFSLFFCILVLVRFGSLK